MNPDAWPKPNTEILKLVEKTEPVEAVQNLEQELSPEQIEQIMAKVQDIMKYGTAFTAAIKSFEDWGKENFLNILKNGLLGMDNLHDGTNHGYSGWDSSLSEKSNWAKRVKVTRNAPIFFNIVGRMEDADKYIKKENGKTKLIHGGPIRMSYYMWNKSRVSIVFDIDNFKESAPARRQDLSPVKSHTFMVEESGLYKKDGEYVQSSLVDEDSPYAEDISTNNHLHRPHSESGFMAHHRISPKRFKGLVMSTGQYEAPLEDRFKNDKYKSSIDWLIENQITEYKDKPEMLLPIYDSTGDLIWPKKMTHEEVQKLAAERDAKNTNMEEK